MAKTYKNFILKKEYIHEIYGTKASLSYNPYSYKYCPPEYYYQESLTLISSPPVGDCVDNNYHQYSGYSEKRSCILHSTKKVEIQNQQTAVSSMEDICRQIEELIQNENGEALSALLESDFLLAIGEQEVKTVFHTDRPSERRGHIEHYQEIVVRPVIEELLLNYNMQFRKLLQIASNKQIYRTLLQALSNIKLSENDKEAIDLRGLDLSGICLQGANFGYSQFTDATTIDTNFNNCNLANTDISQEQLDRSKSYERSVIPVRCWPYWADEIKQQLAKRFEQLHSYAKKKIPISDKKFEVIDNLYKTYHPVLSQPGHVTSACKKQMLHDLTNNETTQLFRSHRNFRYMIAEVISFIAMLGVGYVIVGLINKNNRGHFGIFTTPKTEMATKQLAEDVIRVSPSA